MWENEIPQNNINNAENPWKKSLLRWKIIIHNISPGLTKYFPAHPLDAERGCTVEKNVTEINGKRFEKYINLLANGEEFYGSNVCFSYLYLRMK
jgi:hypothetical protein